MLRRIDSLEGKTKFASSKEIDKLVSRLGRAWSSVSKEVSRGDLAAKQVLDRADAAVNGCIGDLEKLKQRSGIEYLYQTNYMKIVEDIENFFEEQNILTPKQVQSQLDQFIRVLKLKTKGLRLEAAAEDNLAQRAKLVKFRSFDNLGEESKGDKLGKDSLSGLEGVEKVVQTEQTGQQLKELETDLLEYEDKIMELNRLNTEFIKDFSVNVERMQEENKIIKDQNNEQEKVIRELRIQIRDLEYEKKKAKQNW